MISITAVGDAAAADTMVKQAIHSPRTVSFEAERNFESDLQHTMDEAWLKVIPTSAVENYQSSEPYKPVNFTPSNRHSMPKRKSSEHESGSQPAIANSADQMAEDKSLKITDPNMGHILDITF